MKFIALKTDDGRITGNISFYCIALDISRWGFYKYLKATPHKTGALKKHEKSGIINP